MYDPHQSTTVIKPVRKGIKKEKKKKKIRVSERGERE